jgi:tetratricopeptide (TPR) repeat protein
VLSAATLSEPALRAEIRRRLERAAEMRREFFAPSAEPPGATEPGLAPAGLDGAEPRDAAPRYEPGEWVGEGGMARVYRAFDRQLQRPVALKLLRRDEPETRRRFLREAQAQARVRHDHVLEVYETGELRDRPFIAMRWVDGSTLLAIRPQTSLEEKVRVIAQVAEGLHAAHREGLIHRDVKPSNILVERTADGGWKPWIADFGIASWSEGGGAGELAGTPAYLAPELLRGPGARGDRRSDVYSLGVTLYELLTGETPFHAAEPVELLRRVRDDPPRPPRRLLPTLPADLEAIVLKCLNKDPEARYPSARALAEDLRRFLGGQAVEAYVAGLSYRLTRFALRHRLLLAVAGVGALLLAAALAAAAVLGVEARLANRRAELRRGQAEDLIGFMLTDLRGRLEPLGKLEILDGVGRQAMAYFAAVPEEELSDEELARRSQALYQIGDVRIRRGELADALPPLEESLALAQALADRDPTGERLYGLGQSHFWVGYVHWQRRRLAAARPHLETYLTLSQRLVALDPTRADWQLELAYGHANLGALLGEEGHGEAALGEDRSALAILRRLVARDPRNLDWKFELAAAHNSLGAREQSLGRLDEARAAFGAELELRRELAAADPDNARWREFLATCHYYLGELKLMTGEVRAGRDDLDAAGTALRGLVEDDPDNAGLLYKLALVHLELGTVDRALGRPDRAAAEWRRLREITDDLVRRSPVQFEWRRLRGVELIVRSWLLTDPVAARHAARRGIAALQEVDRSLPGDAVTLRWLGRGYRRLAAVEAALGDPAAGRAALRAAAALLEPAAEGAKELRLLGVRAEVLFDLGRHSEARDLLGRLERAGYRNPAFWDELAAADRR